MGIPQIYHFVHIPKAAGTTVRHLIEHSPFKEAFFYHGHIAAKNIIRFAIVRNPYYRLASAYTYIKETYDHSFLLTAYKHILSQYADFEEFVMNIERHSLDSKILHIIPQVKWVCDESGNIMVEKLFKMEDSDEIDRFFTSIGLGRFSDVRINTTVSYDADAMLTNTVIRQINKIYFDDFRVLGYAMRQVD